MFILSLTKIQFLLINILVIFLFGLIYKKYGNEEHFGFINKQKNMDLTDAIFFSANNYATIGNYDVYPKTKFIKRIILVQIFILIITLIMLSSCEKLFE
jgi:hypothetical protein